MTTSVVVRAAVAAALICVSADRAAAQMFELVGTRAQGMGGAFVAVADDATATWWNPAGIGTGALLALQVERGLMDEPDDLLEPGPARRARASGFAFSYPALGLSYYRIRVTEMLPAPTTADGTPLRQEDGASAVVLRSFAVSQYGATFAQSTGGSLITATTVKVMRGGTAVAVDSGVPGAIGRGEDLDPDADTDFDVDIGVMASFGSGRIGVAVKHLREPAFGDKTNRVKLEREARAGLAFMTGRFGPIDVLTLATDADLTTQTTALGDVRHAAGGVEALLFGRRVGLRAGLTKNTVGDKRTDRSAGLSVGTAGLYLDGAITRSADELRDGWKLGIRVTF